MGLLIYNLVTNLYLKDKGNCGPAYGHHLKQHHLANVFYSDSLLKIALNKGFP